VIWQEGVSPTIVVELLSPGTENQDLGQELRQPGEPPTNMSKSSYYQTRKGE